MEIGFNIIHELKFLSAKNIMEIYENLCIWISNETEEVEVFKEKEDLRVRRSIIAQYSLQHSSWIIL